MGIGGSILNKYGGLPEPEPPTKDTPRRAACVLLAGLAILSGFASAAWYSTQGLKIFRIFSLIVVVGGLLIRT